MADYKWGKSPFNYHTSIEMKTSIVFFYFSVSYGSEPDSSDCEQQP